MGQYDSSISSMGQWGNGTPLFRQWGNGTPLFRQWGNATVIFSIQIQICADFVLFGNILTSDRSFRNVRIQLDELYFRFQLKNPSMPIHLLAHFPTSKVGTKSSNQYYVVRMSQFRLNGLATPTHEMGWNKFVYFTCREYLARKRNMLSMSTEKDASGKIKNLWPSVTSGDLKSRIGDPVWHLGTSVTKQIINRRFLHIYSSHRYQFGASSKKKIIQW